MFAENSTTMALQLQKDLTALTTFSKSIHLKCHEANSETHKCDFCEKRFSLEKKVSREKSYLMIRVRIDRIVKEVKRSDGL